MNDQTTRDLTLGLPGLDPTEPQAIQAKQALMIAAGQRILIYRRPVDLAVTAVKTSLKAELGRNVWIPKDGGVYYLVFLESGLESALFGQHPVLIPEHDVVRFVLGYQALLIAQTMGMLTYVRHITADDADARQHILLALGDVQEVKRTRRILPTTGRFHLLSINDGTGDMVLLPEADACSFALGMAKGLRRPDCHRLAYSEGILLA